MRKFNRRKFIKASALLMAVPFVPLPDETKSMPRLAFSTLGCPDWTFQQITDFAALHGYAGIELRGIQRELNLVKCKEFSRQHIAGTLSLMKDKNLQFVDLGSSANLHMADSTERQKSLDGAREFIDLAQRINCPFVRVFPNNFPKEQDKKATMELMTKGLLELGEHAKGSAVNVLLETHGDLVYSEDILSVMRPAAHSNVGLVWDITNMWLVTKEPPGEVYQTLKKYIRHIHIKDAGIHDGKIQYTFLGRGEVPIFAGIDALSNGGYNGYYSFEWEKLWHPEIEEPETALADYAMVMKKHFSIK